MNDKTENVLATQIQNFKMADLAPDHWFQDRNRSTVWISAFRMLKVDAGEAANPQIIDFEKFSACLRLWQRILLWRKLGQQPIRV